MRHFAFYETDSSDEPGNNHTVVVFKILKNVPTIIGFDNEIDSKNWQGSRAVAARIITEKTGLPLFCEGHILESKDAIIHEI